MMISQAMGELCRLMMQHQLDADSFARWVRRYYRPPALVDQSSAGLVKWVARHHAEPHPLDTLRVLEFDHYLIMAPDAQDSAFMRAMIELRNVFARNANLATPATVSLNPTVAVEPVASRTPEPAPPGVEALAGLLPLPARG
jgi:hypothetical protein